MKVHATASFKRLAEHQSIDEGIHDHLRWRGDETLDNLSRLFPKFEEARVLFAIDRLSRAGKIVIPPPQGGDYLISVRPTEEQEAIHGNDRRFKEFQEPTQSPVR
jgi:hypothetical protein